LILLLLLTALTGDNYTNCRFQFVLTKTRDIQKESFGVKCCRLQIWLSEQQIWKKCRHCSSHCHRSHCYCDHVTPCGSDWRHLAISCRVVKLVLFRSSRCSICHQPAQWH